MSMEIDDMAKRAEGNFPTVAQQLRTMAALFRELGGPERFPEEEELGVREFSKEQILGLNEIDFDFFVEIKSKTVEMLLEEVPGRIKKGDRFVKLPAGSPKARNVAVRSAELVIPDSNNLSFHLQNEKLEEWEQEIRSRQLERGTLDGIGFGIGHPSEHLQIDFAFHEKNGGLPLYSEIFACSDSPDEPIADNAIIIGRYRANDLLTIYNDPGAAHRLVYVAPVAYPLPVLR